MEAAREAAVLVYVGNTVIPQWRFPGHAGWPPEACGSLIWI